MKTYGATNDDKVVKFKLSLWKLTVPPMMTKLSNLICHYEHDENLRCHQWRQSCQIYNLWLRCHQWPQNCQTDGLLFSVKFRSVCNGLVPHRQHTIIWTCSMTHIIHITSPQCVKILQDLNRKYTQQTSHSSSFVNIWKPQQWPGYEY